jgi:alpha-tubulin suppressor-like RCC1 family protein
LVAADKASCALTTTVELFTRGDGKCGKLRPGSEADQPEPKLVYVLRDECVVAVTCGERHAVAVVRGGGVFGWGYAGGLGMPEAAANMRYDGVECVFSPSRYQKLSCMP